MIWEKQSFLLVRMLKRINLLLLCTFMDRVWTWGQSMYIVTLVNLRNSIWNKIKTIIFSLLIDWLGLWSVYLGTAFPQRPEKIVFHNYSTIVIFPNNFFLRFFHRKMTYIKDFLLSNYHFPPYFFHFWK
mgnify:CR=1 FL=1